jgi:hypothetical protein
MGPVDEQESQRFYMKNMHKITCKVQFIRFNTSFSPAERLCCIGGRGMGAVEFRPGLGALSTAYDVTFNPNGGWTSRHQTTVNGKCEGIDLDDLFAVAKR